MKIKKNKETRNDLVFYSILKYTTTIAAITMNTAIINAITNVLPAKLKLGPAEAFVLFVVFVKLRCVLFVTFETLPSELASPG